MVVGSCTRCYKSNGDTSRKKMKAFLAQSAGSWGKGPSSLKQYRMDRNTQIHAAKVYAAEFDDKIAKQEAREVNNNLHMFGLGSGVRHRPSMKRTTEGSLVTKVKARKERKENMQDN